MCEASEKIERTPKLMATLVITWSKLSRLVKKADDLYEDIRKGADDAAAAVRHA